MIGTYAAGSSWLHRTRTGVKLAALLAVTIVSLVLPGPWWALGVLTVAVGVLLSTRVPLRGLRRPLAVVLLTGLALGLFAWWQEGWAVGVTAVARVVTFVLLGWAVSLTTTVSSMTDALLRVIRPLRHVGVPVGAVAMTLGLTVRCIPLMIDVVDRAQQARYARGARRTVTGLVVPAVVGAVQIADGLGDALVARGWDPTQDFG